MATERQIAANRVNGLKGGVRTEEGKAISRLNARKHGIFALALTEEELVADLKPVGAMEEILVEKLAPTFMRMRRCARSVLGARTAARLTHWKKLPKDRQFLRKAAEAENAGVGARTPPIRRCSGRP